MGGLMDELIRLIAVIVSLVRAILYTGIISPVLMFVMGVYFVLHIPENFYYGIVYGLIKNKRIGPVTKLVTFFSIPLIFAFVDVLSVLYIFAMGLGWCFVNIYLENRDDTGNVVIMWKLFVSVPDICKLVTTIRDGHLHIYNRLKTCKDYEGVPFEIGALYGILSLVIGFVVLAFGVVACLTFVPKWPLVIVRGAMKVYNSWKEETREYMALWFVVFLVGGVIYEVFVICILPIVTALIAVVLGVSAIPDFYSSHSISKTWLGVFSLLSAIDVFFNDYIFSGDIRSVKYSMWHAVDTWINRGEKITPVSGLTKQ